MTPGIDCSPTSEVRNGPRPRKLKRAKQYAAPRPRNVAISAAPSEAIRLFDQSLGQIDRRPDVRRSCANTQLARPEPAGGRVEVRQ